MAGWANTCSLCLQAVQTEKHNERRSLTQKCDSDTQTEWERACEEEMEWYYCRDHGITRWGHQHGGKTADHRGDTSRVDRKEKKAKHQREAVTIYKWPNALSSCEWDKTRGYKKNVWKGSLPLLKGLFWAAQAVATNLSTSPSTSPHTARALIHPTSG